MAFEPHHRSLSRPRRHYSALDQMARPPSPSPILPLSARLNDLSHSRRLDRDHYRLSIGGLRRELTFRRQSLPAPQLTQARRLPSGLHPNDDWFASADQVSKQAQTPAQLGPVQLAIGAAQEVALVKGARATQPRHRAPSQSAVRVTPLEAQIPSEPTLSGVRYPIYLSPRYPLLTLDLSF